MSGYERLYRDPRSPLTPLAPYHDSVFNFENIPDTTAIVPSPKTPQYLTVSQAPSRQYLTPCAMGNTREYYTKNVQYMREDENGSCQVRYQMSYYKEACKSDNVVGKYNLSPYYGSANNARGQQQQQQQGCPCRSTNQRTFQAPNSPMLAKSLSPRVQSVLSRIGLQKYETIFEQEEIDLPLFAALTDEDLLDFGIMSQADRCRILNAAHKLYCLGY